MDTNMSLNDLISIKCPNGCPLRLASTIEAFLQVSPTDITCPLCGMLICSADRLAALQRACTDLDQIALEANATVFLSGPHGVRDAMPISSSS
jgi:hypothetical protein